MRSIASIKLSSCLLVLFLACSLNIYAQDDGITELIDESLPASAANSNSSSARNSDSSREDFNDLAHNLHPTVYIANGSEQTVYGEGTVIKMTLQDANSLNALSSFASKYKKIELLTLNLNSISDLSDTINLTSAFGLSSLKYVFIRCRFSCNETLLNQFIKRNSKIRVFYLCRDSE